MNESIHRRHIRFLLSEIGLRHSSLLDVGCGWGRIAMDLKKSRPDLSIEGIELDENFSNHFSDTVGPCVTMSVQSFTPDKSYDVIIFVTSLMYLTRHDINSVLRKMWQALNSGGKLICIEPATNLATTIRQMLKAEKYSPTGENVTYFHAGELSRVFSQLPQAQVTQEINIGFLPFLSHPAVHRAIVAIK